MAYTNAVRIVLVQILEEADEEYWLQLSQEIKSPLYKWIATSTNIRHVLEKYLSLQHIVEATKQAWLSSSLDLASYGWKYLFQETNVSDPAVIEWLQQSVDVQYYVGEYFGSSTTVKSPEYEYIRSSVNVEELGEQYALTEFDVESVIQEYIKASISVELVIREYIKSSIDVESVIREYIKSSIDVESVIREYIKASISVEYPFYKWIQQSTNVQLCTESWFVTSTFLESVLEEYFNCVISIIPTKLKFIPEPGEYTAPVSVVIYPEMTPILLTYTLNNYEPDAGSQEYIQPILIRNSKTLWARAEYNGDYIVKKKGEYIIPDGYQDSKLIYKDLTACVYILEETLWKKQ